MQKYNLGIDFLDKRNDYIRNVSNKDVNAAAKKYFKKTTLRDADVELVVLKNFIRIGHSRRYMNTKRYERLSRAIEEVGRMLGGWIQTTEK